MIKHISVDEYISTFPEEIQLKLEELRRLIRKVVPDAEEIISYNMPAYRMKGILVYFAAYKNHIGFYPTGSGIEAFKNELNDFKWSKGAVQFPMNQKLPEELIQRMVQFRMQEVKTKTK